MRVDRHRAKLEFSSEGGERMVVEYDNRGEPFREGISVSLRQNHQTEAAVFLEAREVKQLRDLLNTLYPA